MHYGEQIAGAVLCGVLLGKVGSELAAKLLDGYASLPQDTCERAGLDLAMVGNRAAGRAAPHDDMASALANDSESEPLQRANSLGARHVRESRHEPQLRRS